MLTQIEMENLHLQNQCARKYLGRDIDWEQRRYEIAKEVMPQVYQIRNGGIMNLESDIQYAADVAVEMADSLIKQLKNTTKKKGGE